MTRSHLRITGLVLSALLIATSCSQLESTTVIGQGPTAADANPALVAAISNDVLFQSDPVTSDLGEATCIAEQTVEHIGPQRLADAGVTVSFPNPLAADLTASEAAQVVQVIEECTGVRTSVAGAANATGAVENVATATQAATDDLTETPEATGTAADEDTGDVSTETDVAAAPEANEADPDATADEPDGVDADATVEDVTAEQATDDGEVTGEEVAGDAVAEEVVEDDPTETAAASEVVPAAPGASLTDADRLLLADYFDLLGAQSDEEIQCMIPIAVSELNLTSETVATLVATSPLPMPERRAVNRAMVTCADMRPLIAALLNTSAMPADQVNCLAANLDISGQVEVFSNINAIVASPYEALRIHLGNNPALAACGI